MLKLNIKNIFVINVVVIIAVIIIDKLLGMLFIWNQVGDFEIVSPALDFPANLNQLIKEIWFGETIGLIMIPIALLTIYRHSRANFIPNYLLGCVAFAGFVPRLQQMYAALVTQPPQDSVNYVIHAGAIYYQNYFDTIDPSLQTALPYLLRAQIPFIIMLCIGLAITSYIKLRQHNNRSIKI